MKNRIKQIKRILLVLCITAAMIPFQNFKAYAATGKISFTDPSVTVGTAVSVTMSIEATDDSYLGAAEIMLSYDSSILEFTGGDNANGGAGSIRVVGFTSSASEKKMSFQLNFNTLQAGTATLSVTSQEIYSFNEELMVMAKVGNSKVTVSAPVTYSNDATLGSLAISPGTLSPAFSPDVTSYTATVGEDAATLVVNAPANHSGAKVSLSGNTNLKAGTNKVTCKVTAEDNQTVKTYTISVTKAGTEATTQTEEAETESESLAPADLTVTVDNTAYRVAVSLEGISIPEGYETDVYPYQETEIACARGIAKNLILFYLIPESGDGGFFIYEESSDSFRKLQNVEVSAKTLTLMPLADEIILPDGYIETTVNIKGEEMLAYVPEKESGREFCLFYAMNWNGEEALYRYDFMEETVQRYVTMDTQEAVSTLNQDLVKQQLEFNDLADKYNINLYIIYGLGGLCLLLIIVLITLLFKRKDKEETVLEEETEEEIKEETEEETEEEIKEETLTVELEEIDEEDTKKNDGQDIEVKEEIQEVSKYLEELDSLNKSEENAEEDFEFFDIDED